MKLKKPTDYLVTENLLVKIILDMKKKLTTDLNQIKFQIYGP